MKLKEICSDRWKMIPDENIHLKEWGAPGKVTTCIKKK